MGNQEEVAGKDASKRPARHREQAPPDGSGLEMPACWSPSAARKGKPEHTAAFYQGEFKNDLPADRSSSCKEIFHTHPPFFFNDSNVLINLG